MSTVGDTVRDTTCDSGTCSEIISGVWTSGSAYGFGFNAIGVDVSGNVNGLGTNSIFTDSTYFRQFANLTGGKSSQTVMTENSPVSKHYARITYKAIIPGNQAAGAYKSSIVFTAVPKY